MKDGTTKSESVSIMKKKKGGLLAVPPLSGGGSDEGVENSPGDCSCRTGEWEN